MDRGPFQRSPKEPSVRQKGARRERAGSPKMAEARFDDYLSGRSARMMRLGELLPRKAPGVLGLPDTECTTKPTSWNSLPISERQ